MGSIPLVANQIRPQEQTDILGNYAKALSIRDLINKQKLFPGQQQIQQQQIQQGQQQLQQGQNQIQQQQNQLNATAALNRSYANAIKPDANGVPQVDESEIMKSLAASNQGAQIPGVLENIQKFNKGKVDLEKSKQDLQSKGNDILGSAALAIKNANYDPKLAHTLLDTLPQSPQTDALRAHIDDPAMLKQIIDTAVTMSPEQQKLANQQETAKAAMLRAQNTSPSTAGIAARAAAGDPAAIATLKQIQQQAVNTDVAKAKALQPITVQTETLKQQAAGSAPSGLTPEAIDQAATRYAQTGQMPPMGRGGPAVRNAVMNRAGDLFPQGSIAANTAEYKANSNSLNNLQKMSDTVDAFENTAGKNLDRLIQSGSQIPDLGARFANTPVRMISEKMLGTPAMAKFRADLLTAQTESAKVLSSANASGVLSDSGRHEAQEILSGNLPFPAMMAAANELKNDMNNRKMSNAEQISDIQKRLGIKPQGAAQGGGQTSTATGAAPIPKPANATHVGIGNDDKKKHWLDANGNDLGLAQ